MAKVYVNENPKPKKSSFWLYGALVVTVGILMLHMRANNSTTVVSRSRSTANTETMEYKLALIDGTPDSAATYKRLLDAVEQRCLENRVKIGDMTARVVQMSADEGLITNNLEMLKALEEATSESPSGLQCAEVYAMIFTITTTK